MDSFDITRWPGAIDLVSCARPQIISTMRYDEELKLRQDLAEMTRRWAIAEAEIIKLRGLLADNGIEIK